MGRAQPGTLSSVAKDYADWCGVAHSRRSDGFPFINFVPNELKRTSNVAVAATVLSTYLKHEDCIGNALCRSASD